MNKIFDINGKESTIEELSKIYNLKKEGEALVKGINMYMEEKMSYDDLMKALIDISGRFKKIEEK